MNDDFRALGTIQTGLLVIFVALICLLFIFLTLDALQPWLHTCLENYTFEP